LIFWVDAQLSPQIASWLTNEFGVTALAIRDVGLRDAKDRNIFLEARQANAVIITKDADF
jgi:predicted nuclease of predicted toxin-antitoxin system